MAIISFEQIWPSVIAKFSLCNFFYYTIIFHRLVESFEIIATNLVQQKTLQKLEYIKINPHLLLKR